MKANEKTGIYSITCNPTEKVYIGSSVQIYRRWSQHRTKLRKGNHTSPHLQKAWTKHGESAFEFKVVEECELEKLIEREQYYIDTLNPKFNCVRDVKGRIGVEAREKITAATRARAALITHCPQGHEYTEENTRTNKKGKRQCKECARIWANKRIDGETDEQYAERVRRCKEYYERTKEEQQEYRRAYAESHREEKRTYDSTRLEINRVKKRERIAAMTDEEYAKHLERKRESYARNIGRPLVSRSEVMTPEVREKIRQTLLAKRPTHCPNGHDYGEHGRPTKAGKIECRTCRNDRKRLKRASRKCEYACP
jgi:group I intron endonuclease